MRVTGFDRPEEEECSRTTHGAAANVYNTSHLAQLQLQTHIFKPEVYDKA